MTTSTATHPGRLRHGFGAVAAIVLVHLALAALAFQPAPHPGGDNAVYLSVARSILEGTYRDIFDPAAPAHVVYPPGFPLITAAALALGLKPWVGLKLVTIFFSLSVVALAWFYAVKEGRATAWWVAGITAISPGVIALSHWELSDVPFAAVSIAAILAWRRVRDRGSGAVIIASLLTLASYSIRSAGLAVIVAAALWLIIERRWKSLLIMAGIIVPPAVAWWFYTGGQGGYFGQFFTVDPYIAGESLSGSTFLARIADNIRLYGVVYFPAMFSSGSGDWRLVITLPLLAIGVYEWAMRILSRNISVLELFMPIYAGMVLLWLQQFSGERLLLPAYPFILFYAALGARRIVSRLSPLTARAGLVTAACVVAGVAASGAAAAAQKGIACTGRYLEGEAYPCVTDGWADFFTISNFAATALPDRSVVISRKPAIFFAFSGKPGRLYEFSRDPQVLIDSALAAGARYVVLDYVDHVGPMYVVPAILRRPRAFCVMATLGSSRATLYGIVPGADTISDDRPDMGAAYVDSRFSLCRGQYYWKEGAAINPTNPAETSRH